MAQTTRRDAPLLPETTGSRQSAKAWGFGPLFDAIKDAVVVADAATGRIMLWNRGAEQMLQYTADDAVSLLLEDLVPPAYKEAHRNGLAKYAETRAGALIASDELIEVPAVRKDGFEVLIELRLSRLDNPLDSGGAYALGLMRDITAQRESEQTVRLVLDASAQAMFALDRFGNCTTANPATAALLRCDIADLLGHNMHAQMHHSRPDGSALLGEDCLIFKTFTAGIPARTADEVFWRKDGTSFAADYQSEPILRGGILLGAVVTFSDISDRQRTEAALFAQMLRAQHEADTDVLTGIGNRRYADEALERLRPGDCVVLIDIDRFKAVNDTYGHKAGDKVLVSLARHLKSHLRAGDTLARLGGEEFLVVLASGGSNAISIVERMAASWKAPVPAATFTAGIAKHTRGATGAESLHRADSAMYRGKRAGRDRVVAY